MSWVKIYVHLVFSTKNREPLLNTPVLRKKVFEHIKLNSIEKGIYIDCANGYEEHAHCLISLGREQTISQVAKMIKGESSRWVNKNNLTLQRFSWQDDYWAVGVSEKDIPALRNYIFNQEDHHSKHSFLEEEQELRRLMDESEAGI
jgi:REP element-mobilizing transposase RayT